MTFSLDRVRFQFQALDKIHFPANSAANILRGALGSTLPASLFAPRVSDAGPSGLLDRPRPFVLRVAHLDGRSVVPGESFLFDLNLFDRRSDVGRQFIDACKSVMEAGIGPGHGRAELLDVTCESLEFRLDRNPAPVTKMTVRFLTPTELKDRERIVAKPDFAVLFARVRDRISSLRAFYGPGPLDIDFRTMGERAALVRMTRFDVRMVEGERRSSRTGQTHSLGGFVGEADYEGGLAEFVPYLEAAQFTGVGRQTVWGKGQIEVIA